MKILFVNNSRGRGGGEEFLRDLLPGLCNKGIDVGLLCRPDTPLTEMFKGSRIKVHSLERSGRHALTAVFKTASIIRSHGYTMINIQRRHDILQALLASRLSGRPAHLIYTVQVPEFMKSLFVLSRMNKIVTISRHIRDRMTSDFPEIAPSIRIIHYGIDLDKFKPSTISRGRLRERFRLGQDARIIGSVGDLWKNQIEFLDALVLIRKEIPGARYALVAAESGSGHIEEFKRRASALGVSDAVLWAGRLSKEDMLSFYSDIDIAVNTHRNEGFGIWVLEALAAGTPVVSVNEGGVRDSLDGCPAGALVDGEADAMAHEVIRILRDSSLHTRMADAGPRWTAERFSRERMVSDYFQFFQQIEENLNRENRKATSKSQGEGQ